MYECFSRSGVLIMFFKFKYVISYNCRPNKKTAGSKCILQVVTSDKLEKPIQQAKVLKMLTVAHRVNPNAIELEEFALVERLFVPLEWLRGLFRRNLVKAL